MQRKGKKSTSEWMLRESLSKAQCESVLAVAPRATDPPRLLASESAWVNDRYLGEYIECDNGGSDVYETVPRVN